MQKRKDHLIFKRLNKIIVHLNRTDAGVHATNTTCHIDVYRYSPLPPWVITKKLNDTFQAWHEQIRIIKTVPVRNQFDSRREARLRTYLYRFAVCKEQLPKGMHPKIYHGSMFIPIEESFRCHFILLVHFSTFSFSFSIIFIKFH